MPDLNDVGLEDYALTRSELLSGRGYDLGPETRNGNGNGARQYTDDATDAPASSASKVLGDDGGTVSLNVPLPRGLHRKLRLRAVENGQSLKAAVIEAVNLWTSR